MMFMEEGDRKMASVGPRADCPFSMACNKKAAIDVAVIPQSVSPTQHRYSGSQSDGLRHGKL